jgi:hypothetical protein
MSDTDSSASGTLPEGLRQLVEDSTPSYASTSKKNLSLVRSDPLDDGYEEAMANIPLEPSGSPATTKVWVRINMKKFKPAAWGYYLKHKVFKSSKMTYYSNLTCKHVQDYTFIVTFPFNVKVETLLTNISQKLQKCITVLINCNESYDVINDVFEISNLFDKDDNK